MVTEAAGTKDFRGIHPIIVGTAGHVDHGKSSLVRALTGIDPDRWQEERDRGLTIDLGFAPMILPDGNYVGLIDVPGHERFLKNMVAGATSIDLAILVIAADDGVMPQTREHLDVLELLGVRRGIVALTKVDLVDEETQLLAEEEVKDLLAGTCLEGSEIMPLSSISGLGIDAFKKRLAELAADVPPRSAEGFFRMPVQRVFSVRGFGTVLTGIPMAGQIAVGDQIYIAGTKLQSRVRGIQAYGQTVDHARAGHSTALNLPDIPLDQVTRGDVVSTSQSLVATTRLEMEVRVVNGVMPLKHAEEVHFHLGTCEARAKVFVIDEKELAQKQAGLVQILCQSEVVGLPGDFALLRRMTPARTIAGGRILGIGGRRLRRFRDEVIRRLHDKEKSLDVPDQRVLMTLLEAGEGGISLELCRGKLGWKALELELHVQALVSARRLYQDKRNGQLFAASSVEREQERICKILDAWYKKHPMSLACPVARFRRADGENLTTLTLQKLERDGRLQIRSGGMVQDLSRKDPTGAQERAELHKLSAWLEAAGSRPHSRAEVEQDFGREGLQVLERLLDDASAVAVGPVFVWGADAFNTALRMVDEICGAPGGVLDIPSLRDRLGTSRKFLIPFLEHMDRTGVTARKGDRRILRRK